MHLINFFSFEFECRLSFKHTKFGIADVSNLKINKRSNVEQPNLGVTKMGNKNLKIKASKLFYIKYKYEKIQK